MDAKAIRAALKEVDSIKDLQDIRADLDKILKAKANARMEELHNEENEMRRLVGMKKRPLSAKPPKSGRGK